MDGGFKGKDIVVVTKERKSASNIGHLVKNSMNYMSWKMIRVFGV